MSDFYVEYSVGPRFIEGINIDADSDATTDIKTAERQITDPVTGFKGRGYQPGQKNHDGTPL
jgi:hypothetical protein